MLKAKEGVIFPRYALNDTFHNSEKSRRAQDKRKGEKSIDHSDGLNTPGANSDSSSFASKYKSTRSVQAFFLPVTILVMKMTRSQLGHARK